MHKGHKWEKLLIRYLCHLCVDFEYFVVKLFSFDFHFKGVNGGAGSYK